MRIAKTLLCTMCAASSIHAEPLTSADREALLENLEKIRESADARVDARFRMAIAAYREALASNDAALELYLKCIEKVEFEDQQRKSHEFREWKRNEDGRLSDSALPRALRIQLQWLVLTLQAASSKPDRAALAASAQDLLGTIFQDPEKLRSQAGLLGQDVTSSVFAKAYEVGGLKIDKWAFSPTALGEIYNNLIMPPLRNPERIEALRAAWTRRIQQESAMREFWSAAPKENKRIGMAADLRPPEYDRFLADNLPQLQWEMEMDLFKSGDQAGSAKRMLGHIEKHIQHKSAREWGDEFRKLLAPPGTADHAAEEEPPPGG